MNEVDDAEVAVFGVPLDAGATYRPGTRFGPQGIRRSTNLFGTYNYESGVDLREQLNIVDIGDVFTIPGNLEKSFDQISQAMAHVAQKGVMPIVLGGDHSIGFPTIRGLAPYMDGNIGIIHFDRHVDTQETDLDERMHTTPWFHATNIKNAPATNLVQIGIGGWQSPREGVKVGRDRKSTVITVGDVERVGIAENSGNRTGNSLEGRQGGLPVLRHRRHRRRLRAGDRLAGTGRPAAARSAQPGQDGLRAGPGRHRGRRMLAAVRLGRADRVAELAGDPRQPGRAGPLRQARQQVRRARPARLGPVTEFRLRLSMRIALAQIRSGTDPAANLALVEDYTLQAAEAGASLVLFPEATMCRFGVPLAPLAEPLDGPWASGVRAVAQRAGVVVVAGMFAPSDDGRVTNTLLATGPGVDARYDKIHLYDAFGFTESHDRRPRTGAGGDHRRRPALRSV